MAVSYHALFLSDKDALILGVYLVLAMGIVKKSHDSCSAAVTRK